MRFRDIVFGLVGLIALSSTASAGPIVFNYQVKTSLHEGEPTPGHVVMDLLKGGKTEFGEYGGFFTIGWVQVTPSVQSLRTEGESESGEFQISVDIDDHKGNKGTLTMFGKTDDSPEGGESEGGGIPWLKFEDSSNTPQLIVSDDIGGNRFFVKASLRKNGTEAEILLGVSPLPQVTTPEPGTLLLGMLGLAPIGGRALRRRLSRAS